MNMWDGLRRRKSDVKGASTGKYFVVQLQRQLEIAQMDRDEEEARNVISHFKMIVVELLVLIS